MGFSNYIKSSSTFIVVSLLAQIINGIGCGSNSTALMSIVSSYGSEERARIMGINEAAFGLGMLTGPFIGAGFYSIGGYSMPFFTISAFNLVLIPFLSHKLPNEKELTEDELLS